MQQTPVSLHDLEIRAEQAEVVAWQGREALRLENGLALAPTGSVQDASLEVLIGVEGPAYPGLAFRVADVLNYELAYAVPHVSGQWDALQYDPVFHASNTWQVYHGPGHQQEAQVPTGRWFRLRVDYRGSRAAITLDDQAPLLVGRLAHSPAAGRLGLWTFRPAYFCDLRVSACEGDIPGVEPPSLPQGVVESWFVQDYGVAVCEPHGALNLNRYLPASMGQARLLRRFETFQDGELALEFGFSDALALELDGEVIYRGEHKFTGFADRAARGYVELGMECVRRSVAAGRHCLAAELEVSESFGWGLTLAAWGEGVRWLAVEVG